MAKLVVGVNDLATTHPHLLKYIVEGDPTNVTAGSHTEFLWRCPKGHTYPRIVYNQIIYKTCNVCTSKLIVPGVNDLATTHPHLLKYIVEGDPTTVSKGSHDKFLWRCPHGHEYPKSIKKMVKSKGCSICMNKKIVVGVNDLATTHPHLLKYIVEGDPTTVSAVSTTEFLWRCPKGHTYPRIVCNQITCKTCSVCTNHLVVSGVNDLATTHPHLLKHIVEGDPTSVSAGSNAKFWWRCPKGHKCDINICRVVKSGIRCRKCAGHEVVVGETDLATTHPHLLKYIVEGDPTTVSKGSHTEFLWRCPHGHECPKSIKERVRGIKCSTCAEYGFKNEKPAYLYLLHRTHNGKKQFQIGIYNKGSDRIKHHANCGWRLIEERYFKKGITARNQERKIKQGLKNYGIKNLKQLGENNFDSTGYTESWLDKDLSVKNLEDLYNKLKI